MSLAGTMPSQTTIATSYDYDNSGRLIRENIVSSYSAGNMSTTEKIYLYDESGVIGMVYTADGTSATYYFRRNLQGDVVAIYNRKGQKQAEYAYDAYGNCTIIDNTNSDIANAKAIRYRGYYLDSETCWYFLNSRYYSPEWRRFISPDDTSYLDPESVNGLNLYCYCGNDPVNFVDPSGYIAISTLILCGLALVGMGLTIGGVVSDNNVMTAIGLTMVAAPALISGVGALFSGATYLSIVGGVTAGAGLFTGAFATAEYQEAFIGSNWIVDATGMSEEWYNGLMLSTAAMATAGTIAVGALTSIGNAATPNQMMNSFNKHPNRWKSVKELVEAGRGGNKGGISTYSNYINKWTGSKLGIHKIIRGGRFIHGPHFHPWI